MENERKPNGYWTKERVKEVAAKCKTKKELYTLSPSAYTTMNKNGWQKELAPHLKGKQKPPGYWNKGRVMEVAKKYSSRKEFVKNNPSAYQCAMTNGWLDKVCAHMKPLGTPKGYWTKERCIKEAKKYTTITDFAHGSNGAYLRASTNGWLDDVCKHMKRLRKKKGFYNKEKISMIAANCKDSTEFKEKDPVAYKTASRHNWLRQLFE